MLWCRWGPRTLEIDMASIFGSDSAELDLIDGCFDGGGTGMAGADFVTSAGGGGTSPAVAPQGGAITGAQLKDGGLRLGGWLLDKAAGRAVERAVDAGFDAAFASPVQDVLDG
jgi:hypothetical protein